MCYHKAVVVAGIVLKKVLRLPYCIIAVGGTPPLWHQPAGSSGYKLKLIPK
jgi:hypothetical protein